MSPSFAQGLAISCSSHLSQDLVGGRYLTKTSPRQVSLAGSRVGPVTVTDYDPGEDGPLIALPKVSVRSRKPATSSPVSQSSAPLGSGRGGALPGSEGRFHEGLLPRSVRPGHRLPEPQRPRPGSAWPGLPSPSAPGGRCSSSPSLPYV